MAWGELGQAEATKGTAKGGVAQLLQGLLHGAQLLGGQAGPGQFPADHRRGGVAVTALLEVDLLQDPVQGIPRPGAPGKGAQGALGTPGFVPWGTRWGSSWCRCCWLGSWAGIGI